MTTLPAAQSPQLNGTISAAAAKIQPSVVTISVQSGNGVDVGSGVVLDSAGHILTNNHVVEAAARSGGITVTFSDGSTASATVVGTASSSDLAVIKVSGERIWCRPRSRSQDPCRLARPWSPLERRSGCPNR